VSGARETWFPITDLVHNAGSDTGDAVLTGGSNDTTVGHRVTSWKRHSGNHNLLEGVSSTQTLIGDSRRKSTTAATVVKDRRVAEAK
jgi:hypothetical protein